MRCADGFIRGLCSRPSCPHYGGARTRVTRPKALGRPRGKSERNTRTGQARCCRCKAVKPLSEFYVSRCEPKGHQSRCKQCDNDPARHAVAHG